MVYKKLVFLDIDGVLNNTGSFVRGKWLREKMGDKTCPFANPDPVCVHLLDRLLDGQEDIGIVVSSSWRKIFPSLEELQKVLKKDFGMRHWDRIFAVTPSLEGIRGKEIAAWLLDNGFPERYVILDDDSDFLDSQQKHLVRTSMDRGFGWPEYLKAKELLRVNKKELVV